MKEQFIPYNLALKLKELGFDEECFGYWHSPMDLEYNPLNNPEDFNTRNQKECEIYAGGILAPLWQQSFDWFMNEKHCSVNIIYMNGDYDSFIEWYSHTILVGSYKSLLEAKLKTLEKLIENETEWNH